jgi:WD40 repeat protein
MGDYYVPPQRGRYVRLTAFSPCGKHFVVTDSTRNWDGTAVIYDARAARPVTYVNLPRLPGSGVDLFFAVAFSPDGKYLATSSAAGVLLWDSTTGKKVRTLDTPRVHYPSPYCLAFQQDGSILAGACHGEAVLWRVKSGVVEATISAQRRETVLQRVFLSPDGRSLLGGYHLGFAVAWEVASRRKIREFSSVGTTAYPTVALSPDGRLVLTTGSFVVDVWDAATGARVASTGALGSWMPRDVAFSPDGSYAVIALTNLAGTSEAAAVRGLGISRDVKALRLACVGTFHNDVAISFSPDGRYVVAPQQIGDRGGARIWALPRAYWPRKPR